MITEPGQSAQMIAEEEHKPGPELVQTQLQLMVVQIVLGRRLKLRIVTNKSAQVNTNRSNIEYNNETTDQQNSDELSFDNDI